MQQSHAVHQPTNANFWSATGGLLTSAINAYAQIESSKAQANSTGVGQNLQANTPEYANAATVVEPTVTPVVQDTEPKIMGFKQKDVIIGFGALLVLGLVMRGK